MLTSKTVAIAFFFSIIGYIGYSAFDAIQSLSAKMVH